jgi:hypothetical protein
MQGLCLWELKGFCFFVIIQSFSCDFNDNVTKVFTNF